MHPLFTYAALDETTIALIWNERLDDRLRSDLAFHLDQMHGVERVEVFRYGARIDVAPHVVDSEALDAEVRMVLTLVLEPTIGPIDFEIDHEVFDFGAGDGEP